ncbi:nuclear transport factor 2 family protein [Pseudolabrys sp. FHR47]|uniref:nuclear transport factor 2 family protein n=1 Tax=Pseudolabrys sp. FHR47 TaxID=2562284 RepID=UPI0010BEE452|nr:nuclear transport factor 2 family protein [Pseudolabrys sp. FHR47]
MTVAVERPSDPVVDRSYVEAYFDAFAARDTKAFAAFLHDDVCWTISGPIDLIPYCGVYRGKAAVLDVMERRARNVLSVVRISRENFLVQGNRGAALTRLTACLANDGRTVSYRVANFFRFEDGKLIENMSLMDSFDAAEQMLGHAIDVGDAPPLADDNIFVL